MVRTAAAAVQQEARSPRADFLSPGRRGASPPPAGRKGGREGGREETRGRWWWFW